MVIGVTGQIGTGKSEAAHLLAQMGAFVISADDIGREVVEKNPDILAALAGKFGSDILTPTGRLRRKELGRRAFVSSKSKAELNRIVHPKLLKELSRQVDSAKKEYSLIVIDAALLIDWGWHNKVDLTILLKAGKEIKFSRLARRGFSRSEALARLKSQRKYSDLRSFADVVILNNRDKKYLKTRLAKILSKFSNKRA